MDETFYLVNYYFQNSIHFFTNSIKVHYFGIFIAYYSIISHTTQLCSDILHEHIRYIYDSFS